MGMFKNIKEAAGARNSGDPTTRRKARRLIAKRAASMKRATQKADAAKRMPFVGVVRDKGYRNLAYLASKRLVVLPNV